MKTIIFVTPPYLPVPAVNGGAIESLVTQIIDMNEVKRKANIIVFSPFDISAKEEQNKYLYTSFYNYVKNKKKYLSKIKCICLSQMRKIFKNTMIIEDYYKYVFNVCCSIDFDYIIAEGGSYIEFEKFSKEFGRDRVILHIHHNLLCNRKLANIFGTTISVSDYINKKWIESRNKYSNIVSQKNYVIYNGVDIKLYNKKITLEEKHNLRQSLKIEDDDFLILYVGRIIKEKGVEELLDAVIKIQNKKIKLLIIGNVSFKNKSENKYSKRIEKKCCARKDKIKRIDYIDNKDLYKYYQSSDLQVIPSQWEEAFGLVAVEAGLCKLPAIVTESGGLVEIVDKRTTSIVKKGNGLVNNLEKEIQSFVCNEEKYKKVKNSFDDYYKKYSSMNFYDNIMNILGR